MDVRERDRTIRRVLLTEGGVNLGVLGIKTAAAVATGSLALLGEALHSLGDLANNVIAWFVTGLAQRPPDASHPYGHRKFEILAVFFLATLLAVLAVEIALGALGPREPPTTSGLTLGAMCGVLALNVGITVWEARWAARLSSPILEADASHTAADALTTVAVIVGWQVAARGWPWADRAAALAIAGLIAWLAWKIFQRAIPILVDQAAVDSEQLAEFVIQRPGVTSVRRVRSRRGVVGDHADLVIAVSDELSAGDAHRVASDVEQALRREFGLEDVAIHVEPEEDP